MVRIARDRVSNLFALAEREAMGRNPELADRYVGLARKIGMRYNVRLLREYRELYCRSCSTFWVEGRTVRTRLRNGRRVRTCLRCGRKRWTSAHAPRARTAAPPDDRRPKAGSEEALVDGTGDDLLSTDDESEEE